MLATVSLLIAVVIAPALASNKSDSERLVCFNNLRLIGRAVQMWAGDHNGNPPWRTRVADGGTLPSGGSPKPGFAWFEYLVMSNELTTPKILACPSDAAVQQARSFPEFFSAQFRNAAESYVIGLEAIGDAPRSWVSGDYNLRADVNNWSACSAFVNSALGIFPSSSRAAWTNGVVHGEFGHILLLDGSVEFIGTARLRELLFAAPPDVQQDYHFLSPK